MNRNQNTIRIIQLLYHLVQCKPQGFTMKELIAQHYGKSSEANARRLVRRDFTTLKNCGIIVRAFKAPSLSARMRYRIDEIPKIWKRSGLDPAFEKELAFVTSTKDAAQLDVPAAT